MTRINGTITRETEVTDRGRKLLVTLHPKHLTLRFKGTRQKYTETYDSILWRAIKRQAEEARTLKRLKKQHRGRLGNQGRI